MNAEKAASRMRRRAGFASVFSTDCFEAVAAIVAVCLLTRYHAVPYVRWRGTQWYRARSGCKGGCAMVDTTLPGKKPTMDRRSFLIASLPLALPFALPAIGSSALAQ